MLHLYVQLLLILEEKQLIDTHCNTPDVQLSHGTQTLRFHNPTLLLINVASLSPPNPHTPLELL